MTQTSQTAKIRPLAVAMARAGVRPRAMRRQQAIIIPFPLDLVRRADRVPDRAAPADTPLIALSPLRHAPTALAALAAGFALVALLLRTLA